MHACGLWWSVSVYMDGRSRLEGGIMTSFLLGAFTSFPESDRDRDGRLSIMDMMDWLAKRTREFNASRQLQDQVDVPLLYGDPKG